MGNPFLLATDFKPTVTFGLVSGVHRYQYPAGTLLEYTDCIQIDTSINPGNSGGPLFNMDGELIGINGRGSFEKRGRVNSGVGYAISINQIKNFMGQQRQEPPDKDAMAPKPAPGPKVVVNSPYYKAKEGFANYYFNEQARDKLLAAFKKHGDFSKLNGDWVFNGKGTIRDARGSAL